MRRRVRVPADVTPREAVALQRRLAGRVDVSTPLDLDGVRHIAATDVSYRRGDGRVYASVALFSYPGLDLVEARSGSGPAAFPYVPGLLAFREAPVLLPLLARLSVIPDVIMCDGQGIAHPRRIGLASHVGVVFGVPSVGVAKSVLVGEYREPGRRRGSRRPLVHRGEVVGYALRTREGVKPVFVSPGHLADHGSSCALVLACCSGFRLPEPIRAAHRLANQARLGG